MASLASYSAWPTAQPARLVKPERQRLLLFAADSDRAPSRSDWRAARKWRFVELPTCPQRVSHLPLTEESHRFESQNLPLRLLSSPLSLTDQRSAALRPAVVAPRERPAESPAIRR